MCSIWTVSIKALKYNFSFLSQYGFCEKNTELLSDSGFYPLQSHAHFDLLLESEIHFKRGNNNYKNHTKRLKALQSVSS